MCLPGLTGRLGHVKDMQAQEEAIEVLQQLGLKEYEARCFVGLSRLTSGTAKQLSEQSGVPRTRVYDAIRTLEAQGLVEIHHSSPQRFRAVSLSEATETLKDQYDARVKRLQNALNKVEVIDETDDSPVQQVWAMKGREAIENRSIDLMREATSEIVLVIGEDVLLTDTLFESLGELSNGVDVLIGAVSEDLEQEIHRELPTATTFVTGLEWLQSRNADEEEVGIGRLLLVDRSTILVSSIVPRTGKEQAIFGKGFGNGLVVIARRLMAQGLIKAKDPKH